MLERERERKSSFGKDVFYCRLSSVSSLWTPRGHSGASLWCEFRAIPEVEFLALPNSIMLSKGCILRTRDDEYQTTQSTITHEFLNHSKKHL